MSHIDRVKNELQELTHKINMLAAFIHTDPIFMTISEEKQTLLTRQLDVMSAYQAILVRRLEIE